MTQHIDHLSQAIHLAMQQYFQDLDGEKPCALYELFLNRVEKPLLEFILEQTNGNQSRAAELLGLNRNTLRKKMKCHGIL